MRRIYALLERASAPETHPSCSKVKAAPARSSPLERFTSTARVVMDRSSSSTAALEQRHSSKESCSVTRPGHSTALIPIAWAPSRADGGTLLFDEIKISQWLTKASSAPSEQK